MSANKEPKPELIAIYRLEFYKKQKNWKLSASRKEKIFKKSPEKIDLNITYNIDLPEATESSDPHNIAFIGCDSDPSTNVKCSEVKTGDTELSQEWQESVNIWPNREPSNSVWNNSPHDLPWTILDDNKNMLHSLPKKNVQTRLDELQKAARSLEDEEQTKAECDMSQGLQDAWYDNNQYKEYYHWPVECVFNEEDVPPMCWAQGSEDVTDGYDCLDNIQSAEDLYQPSACGEAYWASDVREQSATSADSAAEFLRGADAAPHSSETTLALPPGLASADASFVSLSRLSSAQLAQAARLYSRGLARVRREAARRQILRNALSLNNISGFEEFPTRDPGPCRPGDLHSGCGLFNDVFVAGSYRNTPSADIGGGAPGGRGRGRGRLTETHYGR